MTVVAVFVHALLQRLHLLLQLRDQQSLLLHLLAQRQQFRHQSFEAAILFLHGGDFFWCHSSTVNGFLSFRKFLGLLSSYKNNQNG